MTKRYAEGSRRPGEVSPTQAAEILECHPRTVKRWMDEGGRGAIKTERRDLFGRRWLREDEVRAYVSAASSLGEI